jgi:hypothetical protein
LPGAAASAWLTVRIERPHRNHGGDSSPRFPRARTALPDEVDIIHDLGRRDAASASWDSAANAMAPGCSLLVSRTSSSRATGGLAEAPDKKHAGALTGKERTNGGRSGAVRRRGLDAPPHSRVVRTASRSSVLEATAACRNGLRFGALASPPRSPRQRAVPLFYQEQ